MKSMGISFEVFVCGRRSILVVVLVEFLFECLLLLFGLLELLLKFSVLFDQFLLRKGFELYNSINTALTFFPSQCLGT
jgi:hypothetical protein